MFWIIPVIKKRSNFWYYLSIGGTVILIIMYLIAAPGSGYPVSPLDITIELFQIVFIILCTIIIMKARRTTARLDKKSGRYQ